jgi:hypothetical protein
MLSFKKQNPKDKETIEIFIYVVSELTCVAEFALTNKVVCTVSGLANAIVLTRVNRARKLTNHSGRVVRSQ